MPLQLCWNFYGASTQIPYHEYIDYEIDANGEDIAAGQGGRPRGISAHRLIFRQVTGRGCRPVAVETATGLLAERLLGKFVSVSA